MTRYFFDMDPVLMQPEKQNRKKRRATGTVPFAISFAVHVLFFFALGSMIIFEGQLPRPNFLDFDPGAFAEPLDELILEQTPDLDVQQVQEVVNKPPIDLVTSTTTQTFNVVTMPVITNAMPVDLMSQQVKPRVGVPGGRMRVMKTAFGNPEASSEGLTGYLYDLKQTRDGKPSDMALDATDKDVKPSTAKNQLYRGFVEKFAQSWNPRLLEDYYRAERTLSATQFLIPEMGADGAPKAYGVEKEVDPKRWVALYTGNVRAPKTGKFRFVGIADDVLLVRFDGKLVLVGTYWSSGLMREANDSKEPTNGSDARPPRNGSWFSVTEGQEYRMEVLIGEQPGGRFDCILQIQEKDVEYEPRKVKKPGDNPGLILPVFQTAPTKISDWVNERSGPSITKDPIVFQ